MPPALFPKGEYMCEILEFTKFAPSEYSAAKTKVKASIKRIKESAEIIHSRNELSGYSVFRKMRLSRLYYRLLEMIKDIRLNKIPEKDFVKEARKIYKLYFKLSYLSL
jgi:hypothetical protein